MSHTVSRTDRLKEAHDRLAEAVESIATGEDWQRMLRIVSKFHRYSTGGVTYPNCLNPVRPVQLEALQLEEPDHRVSGWCRLGGSITKRVPPGPQLPSSPFLTFIRCCSVCLDTPTASATSSHEAPRSRARSTAASSRSSKI